MNKNEDRGERASIGVVALFVGLSVMLAGVWSARQLHIVWDVWPSTDGVVVRGAVQEFLEAPYTKGGMPVYRYAPKIEFRYTVGGRDYSTEAPSAFTAASYDEAAANLVRMYASGTHHPIRYNPRNPGDIQFGTISLGPLAFSFFLLIGGLVISGVGLKLIAAGRSQRAERAPGEEQGIPATVLPFRERAPGEPSTTVRCPACGRPVRASENTCPNCLKSLRAA